MQDAVRLDAPAKLNLGLRVVGRRADGYHLLQSLVVFLDLHDSVELAPAAAWRLTVSGVGANAIANDANLALRAARLLAAAVTADVSGCVSLAATVAIEKRIPVAAGLGGGSADAAAALAGLNRLWGLGLSLARLQELAAPLGADLAVCLGGVASEMGGIGERLRPIAVPRLSLVVANPNQPLATRDVFERLHPPYERVLDLPERFASTGEVVSAARSLGNSLVSPAIDLCPTIATLLDDIKSLSGCRLAGMSGSGASCFGIFDDGSASASAAAALQARRPAWFVRACETIGPRVA